MQELTKNQREFLENFSHPVLKKESSKDLIENRDLLIKLLCIVFYEERRNSAYLFTNLVVTEDQELEKVLETHKNTILHRSWEILIKNFKISENLLEEFAEDLPWNLLIQEQILSETFLRTFKGHFDWKALVQYQILSENFVREFSDALDWNMIMVYQNFPFEVIFEFKDKIETSKEHKFFVSAIPYKNYITTNPKINAIYYDDVKRTLSLETTPPNIDTFGYVINKPAVENVENYFEKFAENLGILKKKD